MESYSLRVSWLSLAVGGRALRTCACLPGDSGLLRARAVSWIFYPHHQSWCLLTMNKSIIKRSIFPFNLLKKQFSIKIQAMVRVQLPSRLQVRVHFMLMIALPHAPLFPFQVLLWGNEQCSGLTFIVLHCGGKPAQAWKIRGLCWAALDTLLFVHTGRTEFLSTALENARPDLHSFGSAHSGGEQVRGQGRAGFSSGRSSGGKQSSFRPAWCLSCGRWRCHFLCSCQCPF